MKVERKQVEPAFVPVVITLESTNELIVLKNILNQHRTSPTASILLERLNDL